MNVSASNGSSNSSPYFGDLPSKTESIIWCSLFALEAVFVVVGNLLTIILFTANKKLRKESLFLVINIAVADLMLGVVVFHFSLMPLEFIICCGKIISTFLWQIFIVPLTRFHASTSDLGCLHIRREILRHLPATEAPNTLHARIPHCYFSGVGTIFACFHHQLLTELTSFQTIFLFMLGFHTLCYWCVLYLLVTSVSGETFNAEVR